MQSVVGIGSSLFGKLIRPSGEITLTPATSTILRPLPCSAWRSHPRHHFPTLKSYLKVTLCDVHHELTKRSDAQAIAADLAG